MKKVEIDVDEKQSKREGGEHVKGERVWTSVAIKQGPFPFYNLGVPYLSFCIPL